MPIAHNFLVTTAYERSWDTNRRLLYLGEWCRLDSRRDTWRSLAGDTHPYHWDDREKYYRDYLYLDAAYERKLADLARRLGAMHGVTDDIRYWRIVAGPWLRFFMDAMFDRFETVRSVHETGAIDDTWILRYDLDDWAPADFLEFYGQFTDDPWNHVAFAECIREVGLSYTERSDPLIPVRSGYASDNAVRKVTRQLLDAYARLLPATSNRVAIISAYIPRWQLWKLQRALRQPPYFYSPRLKKGGAPLNPRQRDLLAGKQGSIPFERLLDRLIPRMIPRLYVEDFADLMTDALSKMPHRPKVLMTANAYQADDAFKLWAAHHVAKGVPLVIAQHGGNMGLSRFNQTEDHQIRSADVFASWGWTRQETPNVYPLPALKLVGDTPRFDPRGEIIVATGAFPRYFYCHYSVPVAGQVLEYISAQLRFRDGLDPRFGGLLKFLLDRDEFGWSVRQTFEKAGAGMSTESPGQPFLKRLEGCRLAVGTHNATVFLETLSANFPTIIFLNPRHFEMRPDAEGIIDALRGVGILHDTPESAAAHVNAIGDHVGDWWEQEQLQGVRREFCRRFARTSPSWIAEWRSCFEALAGPNREAS